jgi:hypothetical protein
MSVLLHFVHVLRRHQRDQPEDGSENEAEERPEAHVVMLCDRPGTHK